MTSQAALVHAEWKVESLPWHLGPYGPTHVQQISIKVTDPAQTHSRRRSRWVPWVIVAPSAIMHKTAPYMQGLGLYAAKPFWQRSEDRFIGRHSGRVVGTYATMQDALQSKVAVKLVNSNRNSIVAVQAGSAGIKLVDGEDRPSPPYVFRINDPRGTRLRPNVMCTPGGWIRLATSVPAFDIHASAAQNIRSELRYDYGEHYWGLIEVRDARDRKKRGIGLDGSDEKCSKCRQVGRDDHPRGCLACCDASGCTAAWHACCLGVASLDALPDPWYCPRCR